MKSVVDITVGGNKPWGRPIKTWIKVVEDDRRLRTLGREDAINEDEIGECFHGACKSNPYYWENGLKMFVVV